MNAFRPPGRQRGQATTELIVAAAVILPMLLLFPLLGNYLDLANATEQASRYVAFEATVHEPGAGDFKSDAALSAEIARRFFSESTALVRTNDTTVNDEDHRNPVWTDPWGASLLPDPAAAVRVHTETTAFNFHAPSRPFWHNSMELPEDNFVKASVTVRPSLLSERLKPFDTLDLSFTRKSAVLANAWNGRDHRAAKHVVDRMALAYPEDELEPLMEIAGHLQELLGDDPLPFGLRDASYDLVPCDRLKNGCR